MKAIVVTGQPARKVGMKLIEQSEPQGLASLSCANYGDVVIQIHASGKTIVRVSP